MRKNDMLKSIALLSGGLDSSVSLAHAMKETEVVLCLTFDYGQMSAKNEISAAAALSDYYKLKHKVLKLDFLKDITTTALVSAKMNIPEPDYHDLDCREQSLKNAAQVWVPNRNGVFINIAAAYAESCLCNLIITGFNREEAVSFPDNSMKFVQAANRTLSYSTSNSVKIISYTQNLNKEEILRMGIKYNLPLQYIWSCYKGGPRTCGGCEGCMRLKRALDSAGISNTIDIRYSKQELF